MALRPTFGRSSYRLARAYDPCSQDIREHGLQKGDLGTVIHSYAGAAAIEAEFMNAAGETIAVLTLPANTIRLIDADEILHARRLMTQ